MTGVEIVSEWLRSKVNKRFDYLTFQKEIQEFAKDYSDRFYRSDSWDRYFRTARLRAIVLGLEVAEVEGKYKTWTVQELKEVQYEIFV